MRDGPVPSAQMLERAAQAGISVRTLKRAKKSLGIKSDKGPCGDPQWNWLPLKPRPESSADGSCANEECQDQGCQNQESGTLGTLRLAAGPDKPSKPGERVRRGPSSAHSAKGANCVIGERRFTDGNARASAGRSGAEAPWTRL